MSYAYSVAIKLSVANLATQGLRLLAGDLLAAHGAAGKLEGKLKALKLVGIGYGLQRIGSSTIGFIEKAVDASKEYTRQLSLMNAAGMSQQEIALSTAAAWKTSRDVLTTTAADNLKAIRELRSVFGLKRMDEAYAILPTVQRTRGVMEALTGKPQENVAFDMVKAIELRTPGVMSKEVMQKNADLMARSLMAFGGTINVNDFHKTLKQTKQAGFGLNDDFVYNYLPTLMQEVKAGPTGGAQSAGTAIATLYRAIVQGVIKKSSIPIWEEMGLIKPSDVVRNATGQMQVKPGGVGYAQLYQENPYAFAQKYAPIIAAYGAKYHLNREQVISGMLGDRNAQWLLNTLIAKVQQFERDKVLIKSGGTSIETYQKLMKTNPQLAEQALHAQWQNILSILGFQVLPKLIPLMVKFANSLDHVAQWIAKHPNLTQGLVIGFGALAVSMSVIGKVMMTAAFIKFMGIGPALTSVAGGLGSLGSVLGKAGLAGAAAVAGYEIGKLINSLGPDGNLGGWIGSKLYDLTHPNDSKPDPHKGQHFVSAFRGKGGGISGGHWENDAVNPFVKPKAQQPVTVHTQINMDGRKVAEAVTQHQARSLSAPLGGANFDGSLQMAPVVLNHAH